ALQLFYASIAVYGWWVWRPEPGSGAVLSIHRWPLRRHGLAAVAIALLTLGSGWLLAHYTDAALPYLDSFVTWSAVLTTWMVARKLLENWLYWLVIDGVTLGLALDRGLYLTAALFGLYLVLVVIGWRRWLATWNRLGDKAP
ncbi:MAG: nicotinamide mononucleotide transporter family protein, partial [Gammaproteobacteria bacterium]|nr:nicotinamide mononucleotide transporter family protein [Gammaproteobacteria bacterium]